MDILIFTQIGSATFVIAEVFKMSGLPTKFAPLVAISVGAIMGILVALNGLVPDVSVLEGLIMGLLAAASAMGLYSGMKKTFQPESNTLESIE